MKQFNTLNRTKSIEMPCKWFYSLQFLHGSWVSFRVDCVPKLEGTKKKTNKKLNSVDQSHDLNTNKVLCL